jgi:hypothetical protein
MEKLKRLKDLLVGRRLLSKDLLNIKDLDIVLDQRECEIFGDEWMRVFDDLKLSKDDITKETEEMIDSIREASFKKMYRISQSPDLAGYVSDDFGLIAEALCLNYQDEWINSLANEYMNNRIPCAGLNPLGGILEDIIFKQ